MLQTIEEVDKLLNEVVDNKECYFSVVLDNEHDMKSVHYSKQHPLYLFIYSLEQNKYYIIDLRNTTPLYEYLKLALNIVKLKGYVRNWRYFYSIFKESCDCSQLIDVQNLHFYYTNENMTFYDCYRRIFIPINDYSQHLQQNIFGVKKVSDVVDFKSYIPSTLLIQLEIDLFDYFNKSLHLFTKMIITPDVCNFNKYLNTLHTTELNGLKVDNKMLYQDYNFFTSTSRPSNAYKMNFNAMSKTSGIRDKITSRFEDGLIVEFDYHASHVQILMDIVDYDFPKNVEDLYIYLGNELGISHLSREEIKSQVFKIMYDEEEYGKYNHIPYFRKVHEFGDKMKKESSTIKTKLFKRQIQVYKRDEKPEEYYSNRVEHKVHKRHHFGAFLNYYIQAHETERNLITIKSVLDYIKDNNLQMKMILYVYDSLAFDIPQDEMKHLDNIKNLISVNNKFKISSKSGKSYGQMIKI